MFYMAILPFLKQCFDDDAVAYALHSVRRRKLKDSSKSSKYFKRRFRANAHGTSLYISVHF